MSVFAQRIRLDRERNEYDQQRSVGQNVTNRKRVSTVSRFGSADAATVGSGVWINWQMEYEFNNLGFYVYRIEDTGEKIVSEFVTGSAFKSADSPLSGEYYTAYDDSGRPDSYYVIEAIGDGKKKVRSAEFQAKLVKSISDIKGSGGFEWSPSANENARPTTVDLALPSDLKTEVISYQAAADLARHREVIALPGARIAARSAGIIRVTKAQLLAAGFDVNSDPSSWQLYLEGVERPIIVGPNADYIEFLGKSLDTVESDTRTYYLIVGNAPGKRIRTTFARPSLGTVVSPRYNQSVQVKERNTYVNQVINGDLENYWGRVIASGGTTLNFSLTGVDQTPGDRGLTIAFQGYTFTAHNIELTLNGNVLAPAAFSGRLPNSKTYTIPANYLVEGTNSLQMKAAAAGDLSLFNSVKVDFPRSFKAVNDQLNFYTDNYRKAQLSGFTSGNVRVFDVTNETDTLLLSGLQSVETNGTFGPVIPAARGRKFYAAEANLFALPVSVTPNNPEMLGVPTQAAQFLLITHSSLMTGANAWAAYRAGQGVSTKVVDVDDIFDEFNYGSSSSYAIEDFLNYAKTNWQTPPQYVLLMGDGSYNPRNYPEQSGFQPGYWNMVPMRQVNTVYLETGSDEALADFNNDGLAELPIGRIAARTNDDVQVILNKTIQWENSLTPDSMNRGALFAYDLPDGYDFKAMSDRIMAKLPAGMPKTTVQRGVPDNATAQAAVINSINTGPYVANYTGHGNAGNWRDPSFFSKANVPSLTNIANTSLFVSLTCLNAYFFSPREDPDPNFDNTSLAEKLLRASNGGAAAVWASSGETTPDVQEVMADRFFTQISTGNITRLGDLIVDAKTQVPFGADVRLSWTLLGDPMLKVR